MKVPPKRKGNMVSGSRPHTRIFASMKVPPKRKGNVQLYYGARKLSRLNESPSEKEGKSRASLSRVLISPCLNESPSEKEGKCLLNLLMNALSRRLNESPSEKEGKLPSM